jgi:hypothetical protein
MITQAKFINATKESVVCILNGTPVIGHAKAMAHYVMGDSQSGNQALKAATRTMGILTGGSVGMTVAGPTGAFAGGIAGGAAIDALSTKIESAIANEYRPNGVIYFKERIEKGDVSAAEIFDAACGIAMDGLAGYVVGKSKAASKPPVQAKQIVPEATPCERKCEVRNKSAPKVVAVTSSKKKRDLKTVPPKQLQVIVKPVEQASHTQSSYTDSIMLLNARAPLGKPDTEDENMKVLRLLSDIKKLQKKWKAKL